MNSLLTYVVGETTTVIATTRREFTPFNYNLYLSDPAPNGGKFYDNREQDGFFYHIDKVKRVDQETPFEIDFIGQALVAHEVFPDRYTLQVGFIIEAVQYFDGPQENWQLETPPWPGQASW